jgi:RimJ/RimL family protein N-acetyltransferase
MTEIKIYRAVPTDAADIVEYFKIVGGETDNLLMDGRGLLVSAAEEERYLQRINAENGIYLIADNGERKVVSVGNCKIEDHNERHNHTYVLGISVLKEYWGRGIAHKMIVMIIDMVKQRGGKKIKLTVRHDNHRAIALYVKCGFRVDGRMPMAMQVNGVFYDEYEMSLILS